VGDGALQNNTTGNSNTALGSTALFNNTIGGGNIALGVSALANNTAGSDNIAIGTGAGSNPTAPSDSIFIGNFGSAGDVATIKIGTNDTQTKAFIAGIEGRPTGVADAIAVLIDSNGQLGTVNSSRRYKEDIQPMGDVSAALLKLRPVTFRYKKPYADGGKPIQYGLIAEEVAEVLPDLAVFNKEGQPETVKYHLLPAFLLAEVQRQETVAQQQRKIIASQAEHVAVLRRDVDNLKALLARLDQRLAAAQPVKFSQSAETR
jgi:hypothetical protein